MKQKLSMRSYIFLSSMLFGMFFGAGNLIFPIHMGQLAGRSFGAATVGFCITGVGLPLLGIVAMGVSRSEGLFDLGMKVGKGFSYFFTCALYLTIGPLFAIPRTATVSFQVGILPYVPEAQRTLGLFVFSLLFFAVVLFFSLRPSGIMTWIGKILNPIFLFLLGILIIAVFVRPMGAVSAVEPSEAYLQHGFTTGLLEGYNTMDALASLAFGIILITEIRKLGVTEPAGISLSTLKAGTLAVALMALIYGSLTYAGAQSGNVMAAAEDGGIAFHEIANYYFGSFGSVLLGVTITFACLKTAVGLVTSCATTFEEMFPKLASYRSYAIGFALFSFGLANVGLSRIISLSIPVLVFLYPLTIMLIFLCIIGGSFHYSRTVFCWTIGFTTVAAVFEFVRALPESLLGRAAAFTASLPTVLQAPGLFFGTLKQLYEALPLASVGMGWALPAVAGFAAGLLAMAAGKRVQ